MSGGKSIAGQVSGAVRRGDFEAEVAAREELLRRRVVEVRAWADEVEGLIGSGRLRQVGVADGEVADVK